VAVGEWDSFRSGFDPSTCNSIVEPHLEYNADVTPPITAQVFMFALFLSQRNCDALEGDLEERYRIVKKKFGKRHANFWYWTQTVRSVGPLAWTWVKRTVVKPVEALIGWGKS